MSPAKNVATVGMIWAALGSTVRAEPVSTSGGAWTYFFGRSNPGNVFGAYNGGFTPAAPATSISTTASAMTARIVPTPVAVPVPAAVPVPTPVPAVTVPVVTPLPVVPAADNPYNAPRTISLSATSVTAADRSVGSVIDPSAIAPADAFINFGSTSFPSASQLTVGTPQPWYTSPSVTKLFDGQTPTPQAQADFTSKVLKDVQQTFAQSSMTPTLTTDPNTPANHTLSVVSNASYGPNPNAIGITDVGRNGFGFIDKFGFATNVDDLAMAVARNVSHELMHAFGVGTHPDTTGAYVDAGTVTAGLLTSPNAAFSPDAAKLINATHFGNATAGSTGAQVIEGEQQVSPVPEPATVVLWSVALSGLALYGRRRALTAA